MTGMFGMPRITGMIRMARMTWMTRETGMTGISNMTQARIHTGFHRFTEIGQIFHDKHF